MIQLLANENASEFWFRAAGQLGVPAVILFFLMFAGWRSAKFTAPIVSMLAERFVGFMQRLETWMDGLTKTSEDTNAAVKRIEEKIQ